MRLSLATRPSAAVAVHLTAVVSDDDDDDDGNVTTAAAAVPPGLQNIPPVLFSPQDWSLSTTGGIHQAPWKPVSFSVASDRIQTSARNYKLLIEVSGEDEMYSGVQGGPVGVSVLNADVAGLCFDTCAASSAMVDLGVTEGGASQSVTVVLASRPAGIVRVALRSPSGELEPVGPQSVPVEDSAYPVQLLFLARPDGAPQAQPRDSQVCVVASSADPYYDGRELCAPVRIADEVNAAKTTVPIDPVLGAEVEVASGGLSLSIPGGAVSAARAVTLEETNLQGLGCPPPPLQFRTFSVFAISLDVDEALRRGAALSWSLSSSASRGSDDDERASSPSSSGGGGGGGAVVGVSVITSRSSDGCSGWDVADGVRLSGGTASLQTTHFSLWALVKVLPTVSVAPGAQTQATYREGDPALVVGSGLRLVVSSSSNNNAEDVLVRGATVRVSEGGAPEDELWALDEKLQGFERVPNGPLELSLRPQGGGLASLAALQTALSGVQYRFAGDDPDATSERSLTVTVEEQHTTSAAMKWATVRLEGLPDPPVVTMSSAPLFVQEKARPTVVDGVLSIDDADSAYLRAATVEVEPFGKYDVGGFSEEAASAARALGILVSQEAGKPGTWKLSGAAEVGSYESLLRSFSFGNTGPIAKAGGLANGPLLSEEEDEALFAASGLAYVRRLTVRVEDTSGEASEAAVRGIEVVPVNDPPTLEPLEPLLFDPANPSLGSSFSVLEEALYTDGGFRAEDPEGGPVTYSIQCSAVLGHVTIDPAAGNFTYLGAKDRAGTDSFTVVARDASGAQTSHIVFVDVVNTDDPAQAEDGRYRAQVGTPKNITLSAVDPDVGDEVYIILMSEPPIGELHLTGEVPATAGSSRRMGFNPVTFYVPDNNDFEIRTISFEFVARTANVTGKAPSAAAPSSPATATIDVINPRALNNNAPVAEDAEFQVKEGETHEGRLNATDADLPNDALVFALDEDGGAPEFGTLRLFDDGAFAYTSFRNVNSTTDTFRFVVRDDWNTESGLATVAVTIEPRNYPPKPACDGDSRLFEEKSPPKLSQTEVINGERVRTQMGSEWRDFLWAERQALVDDAAAVESSQSGASIGQQIENTQRLAALAGLEDLLDYSIEPREDGEARLMALSCQATPADGPQVIDARMAVGIPGADGGASSGALVAMFAFDSDEQGLLTYVVSRLPVHGTLEPLDGWSVLVDDSGGADSSLTFEPVRAGWPLVVRYAPEPYVAGAPADELEWFAKDSDGAAMEAVRVAISIPCSPGHHTMVAGTDPEQQPTMQGDATTSSLYGGIRTGGTPAMTCAPCPAGTYNFPKKLGQDRCFPCALGTASSVEAATECAECPENAFQDQTGQVQCIGCPALMSSPQGSQGSKDCTCNLGTFVADDQTCRVCGRGAVCDETHQEIPKPDGQGWWVDPEDGANVISCRPLAACLPHETTAEVLEGGCADGYAGKGCRDCVPYFYRNLDTNACRECSR